MQKIKAIYLDFDGVLHPVTHTVSDSFCNLPLLHSFLIDHPVNVVISSSWRFHCPFSDMRAKFPENIRKLVIGKTGHAYIGKWPRFNEICADAKARGWGSQWVALDDAFLEFPPDCCQLIRCNPNTGLSAANIQSLSALVG